MGDSCLTAYLVSIVDNHSRLVDSEKYSINSAYNSIHSIRHYGIRDRG
jgi:hypothetical protein